jgi:hypothetical protein
MRMMSLPLIETGLPLAGSPKASPVWVAVICQWMTIQPSESSRWNRTRCWVSVNPSRTAAIDDLVDFLVEQTYLAEDDLLIAQPVAGVADTRPQVE